MRDRATSPPAFLFRGFRVFVVVLLLVPGVGAETALGQSATGHSTLTATSWTASAYSRHAGGVICWLPGKDGSLRVEISDSPGATIGPLPSPETDPLADLESVLNWSGDGWTLILGPEDSGTLNAWGREWRPVPPGPAQIVRLVTASLQAYPGRRPEFGFATLTGSRCRPARIPHPFYSDSLARSEDSVSIWRYQLSSLELEGEDKPAGTEFRAGLVARGRGSGGRGEIVSLDWFRRPDIEGYGLEVTSSRRPGTLRLEPPRNLAVKTPEPEVFLPLWPLSQFIETR